MQTIEHKSRVWRTIGIGIATLTVCWGQAALSTPATSTVTVPQTVAAKPPLKPAEYIGEARCIQCHSQENTHFSETLHAKTFRQHPANDLQARGCEACHGPGSNHAGNATDKTALIGFTKKWGTPVEVQNGQCLTCHDGGSRMHWAGSDHAKTNLSCADCHNTMQRASTNNLLARQSISDTCAQCHRQQRADFRKRSHMPLPEGKISCVDCHNPHGSSTRALLNADSVNDVCYACHAEKRGPMLWEHAPVRENCISCHQPHGSNHDKLLVAARPYLCQQCHNLSVGHNATFYREGQTAAGALLGGGQSPRVIGRTCQNCHSQIHGSNHPAGSRFQR
jgi:DmsE family decaheme c-type cytochrome